MATLADELLQDFEDSGSERGDVQSDDGLDGAVGPSLRTDMGDDGDMQLDGDEEPVDEDGDDHQMTGLDGVVAEVPEDDDDAKAAVEKMQLGAVKDVRKVSTIMDRLEPLLQVSDPFFALASFSQPFSYLDRSYLHRLPTKKQP